MRENIATQNYLCLQYKAKSTEHNASFLQDWFEGGLGPVLGQ